MSDSQYGYATSVLTSKSPQSAAALVEVALGDTKGPVPAGMLEFFSSYSQIIQRHNQSLTNILQQATGVFPQGPNSEYGNLPKAWNSLISALQQDIHANDVYFKNLKLDCIGPLRQLNDNEMGYSELLVNSRELNLVAAKLASNSSADAEYQWNIKAPQTFDNLENYKRHEKQLLFDTVLNFFNSTNSRYSKSVTANEKAVNHLLGEFRIDREMEDYLQFLLKRNVDAKIVGGPGAATTSPHKKRLSSFPRHPDQTSLYSAGTSSSTPTAASSKKKPSKLKSKVGSIFGRKNKRNSKANAFSDEAIAESESASSTPRLTSKSTESFNRLNSVSGHQSQPPQSQLQSQPQPQLQPQLQPQVKSAQPQPHYSAQPSSQPLQPTSQSGPGSYYATPLAGESLNATPPAFQSNTQSSLGPSAPRSGFEDDSLSPNIVKYNDDTSSSSSSVDHGHELSMLKKHDLNSPVNPMAPSDNIDPAPSLSNLQELNTASTGLSLQPPTQSLELLDVARSRQSSGGKYSFEEGDDKNPVATSPRFNRNEETIPGTFDQSPEYNKAQTRLPEPDLESPKKNSSAFPSAITGAAAALGAGVAATASTAAAYGAIDKKTSYEDKQVPPPPPPPSRKVLHHPSTDSPPVPSSLDKPKARRDVNSQMFHNLPGARESFAPPSTLISQDTGNSMLRKNDYFKHFESGSFVESSGLNASIAEVINVSFKDETISTSQVVGEIAFVYNGHEGANSPINVQIPAAFNKVLENNTFVKKIEGDAFQIDPSKILSRTLGGLKYMIQLNESQVPIIMQQVWKFEDHQASLMINLKLNPAYSDSLRLDNFVVSVALDPSVQSTSASSRPQGSFSKEKNRITWRYPSPFVLYSEEKLIARFLTNGKGSEHESGVQLKFSIIDPPVALATIYTSEGHVLPSARHLVSGAYSSHS
ncbi:hypothetical protein QFC19_009396 [Naganishia cerealis]|uniref:Uncharacterized protein n=1 Tax=Naganishia cerealis TaxID=610337 RepID=A0ACC2UVY6_9TREE|nr:hypothetical protein QFC19_009396 [Naganishia cerealis]